jgi:hypothetical protein
VASQELVGSQEDGNDAKNGGGISSLSDGGENVSPMINRAVVGGGIVNSKTSSVTPENPSHFVNQKVKFLSFLFLSNAIVFKAAKMLPLKTNISSSYG